MKKVVAVVVTYNRKDLLIECLNAILNQTIKVNKIVLIDNNSTDGTFEVLKQKGYLTNEIIYYKKLEKNIGGAGGFYSGFKESEQFNPDWLWIMDDDTIPTNNCLEKLLDAEKNIDEEISYLASSVYGANSEFMNVPTINMQESESGYPNWYKYLSKGIVRISQATFVSLLINFKAVDKIGYPMKNYFIWGDDTEYTLRLNKYYGQSYMVGESVAIHKRNLTKKLTIYTENNLNRINFYYYMIRNNLINKKEYYGKKECLKFFAIKQVQSLKVLIKPNLKYRVKKFAIIHKALFAFIFGKYDKKAFKNRLDKNVEYNNKQKY